MRQLIHNSNFEIPNSESRIPNWRGFTLTELLIVIAIIAVLATMSVSMLAGAANDAKISATQARISQITSILQLQMEDYEVRRLPIPNRVLNDYVMNNPITVGGTVMPPRVQLKYLRRQLLMALINSEMPRPFRSVEVGRPVEYLANPEAGKLASELNLETVNQLAAQQPGDGGQYGEAAENFLQWVQDNYVNGVDFGSGPVTLETLLNLRRSGLAEKWRRLALGTSGRVNVTEDPSLLPAEFLYEILKSIDVDGQSSVELLGSAAIANDDNDDFPEIVDAWGDPMIFDIEQLPAANDGSGRIVTVATDTSNNIPLDPRVPRAIGDLQFVVGSTRIPESLPVVERAGRGLLNFAQNQ